MKNYITKEALSEIVSDLAAETIANSESVALGMCIYGEDGQLFLNVAVIENNTLKVIKTEKFEIIDNPLDSFDVMGITITEAMNSK